MIDRADAEQFLFTEARLADEHRYDEWESLWTADALYWVPAGADSVADPDSSISIVYDNRSRIALRVAQLKTGKRHAQDPVSRVARVISNVQVAQGDPGVTNTRATFLAAESRGSDVTTWAGVVTHALTEVDGTIRMRRKVVTLVNRDQPIRTLAFLI